MTRTIEQSVELEVPVRTAYDQWTQFEDFPKFMPSVQSVEQLDDSHLNWSATIGGKTVAWKTEICEQIPDKRIAWKALGEPWNAGVVTFHRIDDRQSKVMVQIEYAPEGLVQKAGDSLGLAQAQVKRELEGYKAFLEHRGEATGAWRGRIANADERTQTKPGRRPS